MRHRLPVLAAALSAVLLLAPAPATAQVELHAGIRLPLPQLPTLVVVQPGIQVVPDYDDEVFHHHGAYWVRRDERWYRAPSPRAEFVYIEHRHVPEPLRRLPPGHYRRYRPPPAPARAAQSERHHDPKKEAKRQRKEEEKRRKAWEREHGRDQGHDRGRDHDHDRGRDQDHGRGR